MDFSDQTIYKVKLTLYVNKKPRTQEAAGTLLELSEKTFVFKNLQRGAEIMAEARIKNPDGFAAWAGKSNTIKLAYNENNLSIRMKTVKYFATGPDFNDAITNKSNIKKIVFGLLSDSSIKTAISEPAVAATKIQVGAESDTYYAYTSADQTLYIVPADEDATEIVLNQDSVRLFYNFDLCKSIEGLGLVDTSNVTDMRDMFYNCGRLTTLDVSGFDTSNVTDMRDMFYNCGRLTTLDLSNFDTSNVTDMNGMFDGCTSLTSLDLSGFDTSNVTDMRDMFFYCSSLTSLDVSGFDTSNVTDMREMFRGCSGLVSLNVSSFDTRNVTDMRDMFFGCESLTTLDLSSFDTSNVTDMQEMFMNCENLTTIYVKYNPASGFVHDRVFFRMFYLCGVTDANGLTTKQP